MNETETLPTKMDLHISRKIWHNLGVLFLVFIHLKFDRITTLQIYFAFFAVSLQTDLFRRFSPPFNKIVIKIFKPVIRESEKNGWAGTTSLLLGAFLTTLIFSHSIASLSLLFLAFADPIASFVGVRWGKDKLINNKSLQGSLAALVVCTLLSLLFFYYQNVMVERLLIVSLLAGFIGALSELLPIGKLDDNLTLPLVSATLLFGLHFLFSGI